MKASKGSGGIKRPKDGDVLFGRGGSSNNQRGNKRYQTIVESRAIEYANLTGRNEKTSVSWEIVKQLKKEGARFLRKDKLSGLYFETTDVEFRKKVSQRLRERALEVREYSSGQGEPMDDSSSESQGQDEMDTKPAAHGSLEEAPMEDDSILADTNMSSLFSPGRFVNEPWYIGRETQQQDQIMEPERLVSASLQHSPFRGAVEPKRLASASLRRSPFRGDVEPECLLSASLHSSPESLEDVGTDEALCGQVDDLSSCSLATLDPIPFTWSFEWAENFNSRASSQREPGVSRPSATATRRKSESWLPAAARSLDAERATQRPDMCGSHSD